MCVARAVVPSRLDNLPIVVMNATQTTAVLNTGDDLAELSPVASVEEQNGGRASDVPVRDGDDTDLKRVQTCAISTESAENGATLRGGEVAPGYELEKLLEGMSPTVTPEERQKVASLLKDYQDIFSKDGDDLGETHLGEHSIETGDARPIRQPLRRHPRQLLQEIDEQVEKLLQAGVVERANSPWASNLVLVKKSDGSYRICVDLRGLNSVTKKDAYPLPRIDACLDALSGSRFLAPST